MTVQLNQIRELLLPGLWDISQSFAQTQEVWAAKVLDSGLYVAETPHIWVPKLSLPEAVLVGAAAAVIKNPTVTRRFWAGWKL